jgi:hypothetical protein
MGLKAKMGNGLNHILVAENKELKLNLLIQILTHIQNGTCKTWSSSRFNT